MTASCLACQAGMSPRDYCILNPWTAGCKKARPRPCCRALTASCLACQAGVSPAKYCELAPRTAGCKPAGRPPSNRSMLEESSSGNDANRTNRFCCQSMSASCLACQAGMSPRDYCILNPRTAGCKKRRPRPCCRALTASCLACQAGVKPARYCKLAPTTAGCKPAGRPRSMLEGGEPSDEMEEDDFDFGAAEEDDDDADHGDDS